MKTAAQSLLLTVFALLTMLVVLFSSLPDEPPETEPRTQPAATAAPGPVAPGAAMPAATPTKYFFDVKNHSADEFRALLDRAKHIYERTEPAGRDALEVVLVLHGPDIAYFTNENYERYRGIVDLAAELDDFGVFDFKICATTADRLGLEADEVPAFVEFVPYGPGEIDRLEAAGFVRL